MEVSRADAQGVTGKYMISCGKLDNLGKPLDIIIIDLTSFYP
jgi:UDP-N-acetylglucosamine pyrophosphorylase